MTYQWFWCSKCEQNINSKDALSHLEFNKRWNGGRDKCMLHPYKQSTDRFY